MYIVCDFKIWNLIQNWKRKLKKIEKNKFSGEKNSKKFEIFFFGKMKKSEKNNPGNAVFFSTQNPKLGKPKNRNFCAFYVYTQNFLWDNSLMLCCFQKMFRDVWTPSGYLNNSPKNIFPEKKAIPQKFRGEKNRKIWPIGRNRPNIFWGQKLMY